MNPIKVSLYGPPKRKRIAETEGPAYRIERLGTGAVSYEELMTVIIGSHEIAAAVVDRYKTPFELLHASMSGLTGIYGLGKTGISRILAVAELTRRQHVKDEVLPTITNISDIVGIVQYEMGTLDKENLWVLLLNVRQQLIYIDRLYKGSVNMSLVRVGEIYHEAIVRNAKSIVLCHNHPSGDPAPSPDDVAMTRSVRDAGKLLDIELLDHVILGEGRYVSLKERGLGF